MKTRKGRRVAMGSVVVGLVVLGLAGYVLRDPLVEEYWLSRLDSEDPVTAIEAAVRLIEMRDIQAIPHVLQAHARHTSADGADSDMLEAWGYVVGEMTTSMGRSALPAFRACLEDPQISRGTRSRTRNDVYAAVTELAMTDEEAVDVLIDGLHDPDWRMRSCVLAHISCLGSRIARAIPALRLVLTDDPNARCRTRAARILEGFEACSHDDLPR